MRSIIIFIILFIRIVIGAAQENVHLDTIGFEEVIIQATRAHKDDPVTFQNISNEQIEKIYSGQDPAVLLQQLSPSIISYSDAGTDIGNYAQFRMRGISQSRINVTLNGVPMNDMLDQGVYFSNFSDFGNSVESIQVQRGVGASNIGVASYGGSINFESTNIFGKIPDTRLQLTAGSFGTLRTAAVVKTGIMKNNIGAYGRVTRTSVNGYKDHSASDSYSFFGSVGILGKKDVWKLTGFMGKTQNDQSYLPVLLDDIHAHPKTNYNHPNDTDDFEQELVQLQYANTLTDKTRIDASVYYGGARGVFPFSIDDQTQFMYGLANNHYGILSHLSFENERVLIKGGFQAYVFERTNYEYISPDIANPYHRDHTGKKEVSLFGKVNYFLDDFSIYGDLQLRSTRIEFEIDKELGTGMNLDKNWLFLNWVGGINYNINNAQSLYISYGSTSREPTRSDLLNGVLQEENVQDLEIGWRYKSSDWKIDANLFHMVFENEISQVGALQEQSYMEIRQNVPHSQRSGLELVLGFVPVQKVSVLLNGAFMNTNVEQFNNGQEVLEDVSHIFAPKWVIRPQVDVGISEQIGFIVSGRHVSSSFMELANRPSFALPAHTVMNAQLDVAFNTKASMSLQLNNIFNQRYFTDGAPVDLDYDGQVEGPGFRIQPPRHFYLMFTLSL